MCFGTSTALVLLSKEGGSPMTDLAVLSGSSADLDSKRSRSTSDDFRESPVPVEPILVPAKEAARLCGISPASWYRLIAQGKLPAAVKLGGRILWSIEDLRLFVRLGCPDRTTFEARRRNARSDDRK